MDYIFFGTPKFAETILKGLLKNGHKPACVVTAPDKPVGRKQEITPPPVKVLAEKEGVPVLQPNKFDENVKKELKKNKPDLFIVAAYGKILSKDILDIPKHGSLNVHPSLLPKYRGPSPIHYAILEGDTVTGTTIMLMDEKMDHGPILAQEKLKIDQTDTTATLTDKLADHGISVLSKIIDPYISGAITPKEQDHTDASYTHIIEKSDGHINWNNSASFIERQSRALTPWPGVFTYWNDKRMKITSVNIAKDVGGIVKPGEVIRHNNETLAIGTKQGIVIPGKLQIEGKKEQDAEKFLDGYPDIIGSILK